MPVMAQTAARDLAPEVATEAPVEAEAVSCDAAGPVPEPQAAKTRRLHTADWAAFTEWRAQERHLPLPGASASIAACLLSTESTSSSAGTRSSSTCPGRRPRGGEVVALARATCPVRALDGWLHSSDIRLCLVFRMIER